MVLELELNSLEDVNSIKVSDTSTHEFGTIIEDIKHILFERPKFTFEHIFREANIYANILTKMGACGTSRLLFVRGSSP